MIKVFSGELHGLAVQRRLPVDGIDYEAAPVSQHVGPAVGARGTASLEYLPRLAQAGGASDDGGAVLRLDGALGTAVRSLSITSMLTFIVGTSCFGPRVWRRSDHRNASLKSSGVAGAILSPPLPASA